MPRIHMYFILIGLAASIFTFFNHVCYVSANIHSTLTLIKVFPPLCKISVLNLYVKRAAYGVKCDIP